MDKLALPRDADDDGDNGDDHHAHGGGAGAAVAATLVPGSRALLESASTVQQWLDVQQMAAREMASMVASDGDDNTDNALTSSGSSSLSGKEESEDALVALVDAETESLPTALLLDAGASFGDDIASRMRTGRPTPPHASASSLNGIGNGGKGSDVFEPLIRGSYFLVVMVPPSYVTRHLYSRRAQAAHMWQLLSSG